MAIAISLNCKSEAKDENFKTKLQFGGQYGTYVPSHKNIISPGDSLSSVELLRETERKNREVLERERSSHTNSSSSYEIVSEDKINNCVEYLKRKLGVSGRFGYGGRLAINSSEPVVGGGGAEKGNIPHAVYIEKIDGDNITITESNWKKNYITRRVLKKSDFLGFII